MKNKLQFIGNLGRIFFPEHGLNMANYSQNLAHELADIRKKPQFVDRFYFSHYD